MDGPVNIPTVFSLLRNRQRTYCAMHNYHARIADRKVAMDEVETGAGSIPRFAAWDVSDAMRKSLRGMEHLNVQKIADELGVSRNTVGNWLNGRVAPDDRTLMAWARLTAVPFPWLVSFKNRGEPVQARFTDEEQAELEAEAARQGISLSVLLRQYIQPPIPEADLERLDTQTLRQMWFENNRIYLAQKADTAPREMADFTSLYSPIMSTRLEDVLNARGVFPALELNQLEERTTSQSSENVRA
jgi:transcriptional regulator with XRE-family HTH domain